MESRSGFDGPGSRAIVESSGQVGTGGYRDASLGASSSNSALGLLSPLDTRTNSSRNPSTNRDDFTRGNGNNGSGSASPLYRRNDNDDQRPNPTSASPSSSSSTKPPSVLSTSQDRMRISQITTSQPRNRSPTKKEPPPKMNVKACAPCKKAHLACDMARPCKRCIKTGKEQKCEDLPSKKRGRPRAPPSPFPLPYNRPMNELHPEAAFSRGFDPSTYPGPSRSPGGFGPNIATSISHPGVPGSLDDIFELFTAVDLRIIRGTANLTRLTGILLSQLVDFPLTGLLHPFDQSLVEKDRNVLLSFFDPSLRGMVDTDRDTESSIHQLPDDALLRPMLGMPAQYPNQNVRVICRDGSYSYYNVRIHLGGALGAGMNSRETLSRNYFCVSFLRLLQTQPPSSVLSPLDQQALQPVLQSPPTGENGKNSQSRSSALPSFSTITAGIEAPISLNRSPTGQTISPLIVSGHNRPPAQPGHDSSGHYEFNRRTQELAPGYPSIEEQGTDQRERGRMPGQDERIGGYGVWRTPNSYQPSQHNQYHPPNSHGSHDSHPSYSHHGSQGQHPPMPSSPFPMTATAGHHPAPYQSIEADERRRLENEYNQRYDWDRRR